MLTISASNAAVTAMQAVMAITIFKIFMAIPEEEDFSAL
jgi:hypothetical protein